MLNWNFYLENCIDNANSTIDEADSISIGDENSDSWSDNGSEASAGNDKNGKFNSWTYVFFSLLSIPMNLKVILKLQVQSDFMKWNYANIDIFFVFPSTEQ